jgi:hypothetical protein
MERVNGFEPSTLCLALVVRPGTWRRRVSGKSGGWVLRD